MEYMVPTSRHRNLSQTVETLFHKNKVAGKMMVLRKTKLRYLWVVLLMNTNQNACSFIKDNKLRFKNMCKKVS
jgi:hypothetical protein